MNNWLHFLLGMLLGGCGGVFLMCLMAISRSDKEHELTCTRECDLRTGFEQEIKIK